MKLPAEIRTGALVWKVLTAQLDGAYGLTDCDALTITIDPKRNRLPQIAADSLLHESLHGLLFSCGLYSGEHSEETFVSVLTPALRAFFLDNPELTKLITR